MPEVHIIAGEQGSGKSTLMKQLLHSARSAGILCGGFIAIGFWRGDTRSGFDLMLVSSGRVLPFCRDQQQEGWIPLRRFFFSPETLATGIEEISVAMDQPTGLWLIDEIGPIDLEGKLWHDTFRKLLQATNAPVIVTIRPAMVNNVISHFGISNYHIHLVDKSVLDIITRITRQT